MNKKSKGVKRSSSSDESLALLPRTSASELKDEFLEKLTKCKAVGCVLGKHFVAGSNDISKKLESHAPTSSTSSSNSFRKASPVLNCIVLSKDSPSVLHNYIVHAAKVRQVPIIVFSRLSHPLAKILNINTVSCWALLTNEYRHNQDQKKNAGSRSEGGDGEEAGSGANRQKKRQKVTEQEASSGNSNDIENVLEKEEQCSASLDDLKEFLARIHVVAASK